MARSCKRRKVVSAVIRPAQIGPHRIESRRAEAEILERVPRGAFRPSPMVQSAIVRLTPRKERLFADEKIFDNLTRSLFNQRRKKVKKGLAMMKASPDAISRIDPVLLEKRPQDLTIDDVILIAQAISSSD